MLAGYFKLYITTLFFYSVKNISNIGIYMSLMNDTKMLVKPLFILTSTNVLISLLAYVLTITLANTLGPTKFGAYSHIFIISALLSVLIKFGTEQTASASHIRGGSVSEVLNNVFIIRLVCGLLCFIVLTLLEYPNYLLVFFVLLTTLKNYDLSCLYEMREKNERYAYVNLGERVLFVSGAFVLIYFDYSEVDGYFMILGMVTMGGIFFQLFDSNNHKYFRLSFRSNGIVENVQQNFPITVVSLSAFTFGGFSRLILEEKMGVEVLGVYSLGWQLITIGTIFQAFVYRIWRRRIASALKSGLMKNLVREIQTYFLLATFPMVLIFGIFTLFAEPIVTTIFSSQYFELVPLMPIFGLYIVLTSLAGLVEMLWVATGKNQTAMFLNIAFSGLLLIGLFNFSGSFQMIDFLIATVSVHVLLVVSLAYIWFLKFRSMFKT